MGHVMHVGWLGLFGGVLVVGCSLSGLVFDRDSSSTSSGTSTGVAGGGGVVGGGDAVSTSVGAGGGDAGVVATCLSQGGEGGGEVDCNDGRDNDKNFKPDCEDPHCSALGYKCFSVPVGWTSVGAFYESPSGSSVCCPKDLPDLGPSGGQSPSAGDAICNPCTCNPAGVQCALSSLFGSTDLTCTTTAPINVVVDQCLAINGPKSFKMAAPTPSASPCVPSGAGVSADTPKFTWAVDDRVCTTTRSSKFCGGEGHFCVRPTPEAPLCIWRNGAATCPSDFPQSHTFFTGVNDTRDCPLSSCTCGPPSGTGTCTVTTALHSTVDCTLATLGEVPPTGVCTQPTKTTVPVLSVRTTSIPSNNPTCVPSGISPTGTVVANQDTLTTVCCP
jgi:hypothetical protein